MEPNEVQLTTLQKIKPLLKAINNVLPWQLVALACVTISCTLAVMEPIRGIDNLFLLGLVNIAGFLFVNLLFFIPITFLCMISLEIFKAITDGLKSIREHYQTEALIEKQKVLEEVIEKEVLK